MELPPLNWWQQEEVDRYALEPRRGLFWGPRCRKTRAAIVSMIQAKQTHGIIVTPLSACPQWARLLSEGYGLSVIRAYSIPRIQLLRELREKPNSFVVIGWRALDTKNKDERESGKPSKVATALLARENGALILDESHYMAAVNSRQGRFARRLARRAAWVRLLTGTPVPNHYGGLWGQLVALDPEVFESSYERFAAKYLIRDSFMHNRVSGHLPSVETELRPKMMKYVSIRRRTDLFGPDQFIEETKNVELPPAARALYTKLAKEWVIDSPGLDASSILTRLVRLQQLASGYIVADSGDIHPVHTAKTDAVIEDLEKIVASDEKAVVFHRFTWEGDEITNRARKLGVPVYRMNGDTPVRQREKLLLEMEKPGAKIAVVQTKTGGTGISFAEVPYQLVMSQSFSFVDEEQRHDRSFKDSTARFVTYYRAADTIDGYIEHVINNKLSMHNAAVNADRQQLAFGMIPRRKLTKKGT